MKVRGLLLVLLVPWFVHAGQQYYGTQAASVALVGTDSQADLQAIPLHAGDLITVENVRASIQALYDTGHYAYVDADAAPAPAGGTSLTFHVRPLYFFGTIRLKPDNLLERSLSGYFRLPLGEKFTTSVVDRIVNDTLEILKAEGYFKATIKPDLTYDAATRLGTVTLQATPGQKARVATVHIQGGEQTFPPKELLDAMDLHQDDDFSASELDKSLANIRTKFNNLGFLNTSVTVDQKYDATMNTVDLNLNVQPGQFTLVETIGYDIPTKTVRQLVPVFEEGAVDQDLVEEGRVQVGRFMEQKGFFEASVRSEIIEAPLDNAIQINYTIDPGASHHIESVRIEGNKQFKTEEIKKRIQVRTATFFTHGVFSQEILDQDVRTIEAMYRNAGLIGTRVRSSYTEHEHIVDILFQIEEGSEFPVEILSFVGNYVVSDQELRKAIQLKEGDIYTPVVVDRTRAAVTQVYYSKGYPDVRVDPSVNRVELNHGMNVTFQIMEGDPYRIGEILVAGNTLTKDKIIHRNSKLYPNTPYNPEAILEGQQRLYATGLFNRVEIVTLQENLPGVRNLLIQVEDAKPIQLTYGFGYQEYERLRGTVGISHSNLFGLDRQISLRARGSVRERFVQATYREPRLFNHDLDGFGSTFVEHTERPFFTANRIDFSLQVLKRFSAQQNFLVTSSYQTVNNLDIRSNPHAQTLPFEVGPCTICQIGRIGTSLILDRRNDPLNPTSGSFRTMSAQVASPIFGSELSFTSLFNQSSFYTPVPHGVLATSWRLGWNRPFGKTNQLAPGQTQKLPPTERYFAGGSTTLRGFGLDEASPEGGNVMTIGNIEYRVPLRAVPISGVDGALFYDTGNVFPSISAIHLGEFTHTVGFGVRYQTPVGPVRLDFGFNLQPQIRSDGTREPRMKVFFTLGNPF